MNYYVLVMWDNFINKYYNMSYHLGHYLTAISKMKHSTQAMVPMAGRQWECHDLLQYVVHTVHTVRSTL